MKPLKEAHGFTCRHTHNRAYARTHAHKHTLTDLHTGTETHTHSCINTHTHTQTDTHTLDGYLSCSTSQTLFSLYFHFSPPLCIQICLKTYQLHENVLATTCPQPLRGVFPQPLCSPAGHPLLDNPLCWDPYCSHYTVDTFSEGTTSSTPLT